MITEDGKKQEILTEQCQCVQDRVDVDGLGDDLHEDAFTAWSNGWLFFSVTVYGKNCWHSDVDVYAIKYDKELDEVIKVGLPAELASKNFCKMKDGNIVFMADVNLLIDGTCWVFDVVDGTIEELSPGQFGKMYGDVTERKQNALYWKITTRDDFQYPSTH